MQARRSDRRAKCTRPVKDSKNLDQDTAKGVHPAMGEAGLFKSQQFPTYFGLWVPFGKNANHGMQTGREQCVTLNAPIEFCPAQHNFIMVCECQCGPGKVRVHPPPLRLEQRAQ